MSYSKSPGDFEAELPGEWPPCNICDSIERVALASLGHRNIGFRCGEMHSLLWEDDNGDTGRWIPHYHFWPGGQFADVIPDSYIGVPKAKDASRRYDINERRLDWIHAEQTACAACDVPPIRDEHNGRSLYEWLQQHRPDLFAEVYSALGSMSPRPTFTNWFQELIKHKNDLAHEVIRYIRDSKLQADHTIPKPVLQTLWASWDADMRRAATSTLAFGRCRPHNNGKSKRLPAKGELLELHIKFNYGGNERAARTDVQQWKAVNRVVDAVEAYRATYEALAKRVIGIQGGGSAR